MKEKVAILTNFMEFQPGYSLTGIVKDQVEMLTRHGHEVHLFVNSKYHGEDFPGDVTLRKEIPFAHLKDYTAFNQITEEHKNIIQQTQKALESSLQEFDIAFTHDFIFTGWFLIYGEACKLASRSLPKLKWLHWVHSVPSVFRDWWNISAYGPNHKVVYPNQTDRLQVAEQFRGTIDDVVVIPHIKDLRTFWDFHEDTRKYIDKYPGLMQADVVQVLPASVDRLEAKRVAEVMQIFSEIKAMGRSVFLLIAAQWATGRQQKENVDKYRNEAVMKGLINQEDFAFTSDYGDKKYDVGVSKEVIRELLLCSNLFIFPTREESFGLVVPEAGLSGCLMVLNKSLHMQIEISGTNTLYFDFGSFSHDVHIQDPGRLFHDIGKIIVGCMRNDWALKAKTFMRQTYNYDSLYRKAYLPAFGEAKYTK